MKRVEQELLEIASDLLGVIHPDGLIEIDSGFWRKRLCKLAESCQGLSASDFVHAGDLADFLNHLADARSSSEPIEFESRVMALTGHALWIRWRLMKSRVHPGVVFCGKDITDEKTSRTQLGQIEEASSVGGWEIDMDTNDLYWSPQTYAIHELDPKSYMPKLEDGLSFYPEESREIISKNVQRMMETGEGYDVQLRFRTAKGNLRWVRCISRVEMCEGAVVRCYGSIQDITEQVDRDSNSRAMGERFEAIVNHIPLMVSLFDPEGKFVWINPGWEKELGWDLDSMNQVDMLSEFYPDPVNRQEVLQFMTSGSTEWRDFLTRKRDGTNIYTSWANVRLSNGFTIGIGRNINESKQSEAKLVEQIRLAEKMKQRLEIAVRAGRFGVWDWNLKTGELVWDSMMYDIFDIDPLQFTNDYDAFQKTILPEDAVRVRDQLDFTFRIRAPEFKSEFRIVTKTGGIKTISALASCFYDSEGKIDRLVGNNWDVTQQRNSEAALAEARMESERFFTLSLDLLAVAGFDGYFKRVNPAFINVLGYSESEILSKPFIDFVHPDDRDATLRETMKHESGQPTLRFENRFRTASGKYRTFSWVSTPDTETNTIFCAVRDLTDQRENELKLLQSAKMASLGEMAGGVAHEVNNPLAIIHGRAAQIIRALNNGQFDLEKLKTDIGKIEATADRIAKIIRGLRTFSRDSSSDPMILAKVTGLINEVLDLASERLKNHNVKLSVTYEEDFLISCRPQQIGQILLNLINNAHDAVLTQSERWVRIDVARSGPNVRISVIDSGKGIPAGVAAKIMNPFFTTKEVGKGTGLGLSISKGIAEDHGGTLTYSATSANTTFIFELPIATESESANWRVS